MLLFYRHVRVDRSMRYRLYECRFCILTGKMDDNTGKSSSSLMIIIKEELEPCACVFVRACVCMCMCLRAWVCAFMFLCVYACTRTYVCIVYPLTSATHHLFHCLPGRLHSTCCEPILSVSQRCPHIDQCVISGIIGTYTSLRHCLLFCYNLGPTYLLTNPFLLPVSP